MADKSLFRERDATHLVRATLAGDPRAFEELIRRARPDVLTLLRRQARDAPDVDELYQEVVIRAYQSLPRLRNPRRFRRWLLQIAFCTSVDWIRRQRLLRKVRSLDAEPPDRPPKARGNGADAERCLPVLVDEIARLNPKHATALLLRGLEGMAYREIAARLEISLACVKTYLHRARHCLRNRMAGVAAEGRRVKSLPVPPVDSREETPP